MSGLMYLVMIMLEILYQDVKEVTVEADTISVLFKSSLSLSLA